MGFKRINTSVSTHALSRKQRIFANMRAYIPDHHARPQEPGKELGRLGLRGAEIVDQRAHSTLWRQYFETVVQPKWPGLLFEEPTNVPSNSTAHRFERVVSEVRSPEEPTNSPDDHSICCNARSSSNTRRSLRDELRSTRPPPGWLANV